ncbi:unnamed protein product, partial [Lampetra planeri]
PEHRSRWFSTVRSAEVTPASSARQRGERARGEPRMRPQLEPLQHRRAAACSDRAPS